MAAVTSALGSAAVPRRWVRLTRSRTCPPASPTAPPWRRSPTERQRPLSGSAQLSSRQLSGSAAERLRQLSGSSPSTPTPAVSASHPLRTSNASPRSRAVRRAGGAGACEDLGSWPTSGSGSRALVPARCPRRSPPCSWGPRSRTTTWPPRSGSTISSAGRRVVSRASPASAGRRSRAATRRTPSTWAASRRAHR